MNFMFLLSLIVSLFYYILKGNKSLHMLQQNWYNEGNRYIKWLISSRYKILIDIDMLFVIFIICMFFDYVIAMSIFIAFYVFYSCLLLKKNKTEQIKKPLVFTKRVKRLVATEILIYLLVALYCFLTFDELNLWQYYIAIGALIYLNTVVILIANYINIPIEKIVFNYYKMKAKNKITGMNNLKVIGITGSYGKTSSKNILNDILSVKFNTCPTPKNFNTTNGLMITINNYLDKFNDVFIAEMGAFKQGEIQELCDLVKPKYGILTKIGTAHMDSFGSQENIQKGKFELIESLPSDGLAVLNKDDELQVSYHLKNDCQVLWIGIEDKDVDVRATDIKQTHKGMVFNIIFKDDKKKYAFETKLLGRANIYNILAGIALGRYMGISIPELIMGVKSVKTIEHRLELKKYADINIIDDAYNSNPVGSKMALEVLDLMPGKKIIVTPGMIELGDRQYELNMKFGEYIAEVCDEVILVGESQTKPIYDGLMNKKYKEKNIHIINDVKLAFSLMHELKGKETYVLLENDLPDIFNEK